MRTRVPDYFKKFKCIASECEDTCCAGWEIVVDDETHDCYKSVQGEFGDRLKNEIVQDEDGDNIFVLKGNRCAFLDEKDMCDIYKELGEEYLCYTCKEYPRFTEEFGNIREVGLSLSCPEAARIIFRETGITEFEVSEDDEMVAAYNDISYDIFMQLLTSRKLIMKILQDRSIKLNARISIVLNFSQEIQNKIDENKIEEIEHIRKKYSDTNFIKSYIDKLEEVKGKQKIKYYNIREYLSVYKNIDHINEECPKVLDEVVECFYGKDSDVNFYIDKHKEFNAYYDDKLYEFEHLMVYFIFRYFMKAVYDYDVSSKVKFAVVSMLMIKELDVARWIKNDKTFTTDDQVEVAKMYSKDIEHSEENVESLYEVFEKEKAFNLENLMIILFN